jgi:hypothetical protein
MKQALGIVILADVDLFDRGDAPLVGRPRKETALEPVCICAPGAQNSCGTARKI